MLYVILAIMVFISVLIFFITCKNAALLLDEYNANNTHWLWKLSVPNIIIKIGRIKDEYYIKPEDRMKCKLYYYYLKYSSIIYIVAFIFLIGLTFFNI